MNDNKCDYRKKLRTDISGFNEQKSRGCSVCVLRYFLYQSNEYFELIFHTLQRYQKLNGDLLIKKNFKVPVTVKWDLDMRGVTLGVMVQNIRFQENYIKNDDRKRRMLVELGIEFKGCSTFKNAQFDLVHRTLQRYETLNGNLFIPVKFIVPETKDWDKEMWGSNSH